MEYKKNVAFVSGVSDGIGAAFTKILLQNGWDVIGISRNEEKLNSFQKSLNSMPNVFKGYKCDVQNIEKLKKIANENNSATLLFLNAGIYNPIDSSKSNLEIYKEHINVNLLGVINCYEAFLPKMIENGDGKIIIMSSISGWIGLPKAAAYGPTKAALRSFAQSIRYELKPKGISVQVCSPGFVETSATSVNDFYMPGLMKVDDAAKLIYKNMFKKKFEFSFPFTFSLFMRLLSILPDKLSSFLIRKSIQ
jgi:short-subunit dehydrogenase